MSEDLFQGYKGKALETLKKFKVNVWDDAEIESTGGHFSGKILPRAENTNENHLVLKLSTGYNIGIHIETITKISGKTHPQNTFKIPEKVFLIHKDYRT